MRTVLAALDASADARPVLETALRIGALTGGTVEAVHVRDGPVETPRMARGARRRPAADPRRSSATRRCSALWPSRMSSRRCSVLEAPLAGDDLSVAPALHVLERRTSLSSSCPPQAPTRRPGRCDVSSCPSRAASSPLDPVAESLRPLLVGEVELVVLHVFTKATMPRVLDRPVRDLALWGDEFLARFCPEAGSHRAARPVRWAAGVAEVCADQHVDLVVLSWSQDSLAGTRRGRPRRARTLDDPGAAAARASTQTDSDPGGSVPDRGRSVVR